MASAPDASIDAGSSSVRPTKAVIPILIGQSHKSPSRHSERTGSRPFSDRV